LVNRKRLTDEGCKRLKPVLGKQLYIYDAIVPRLMLRLNDNSKSWSVLYYIGGKPRSKKLGTFPAMGVKAARDAARKFEENPQAALARTEVGSFGEIAEQFMKRHVEASGLRSKSDIERSLGYVLRRWRDRPFLEIRRRDVANLLDEIEDKHSAGVADGCLAVIRKLMNWYAARSDDYTSPVVAGMSRAKSQARERILTDDELRAVWSAADTMPVFGDLCRLLLLTGQRRSKVAQMKWADVDLDTGVWTIATEPREKGNPGKLLLPEQALAIIRRQPRVFGCDFIFAGRGGGHINGFNKRKAALDAQLGDTKPWTLHDLRRTARSLLSRAGVRPEISERVLGHAIGGVEAVYDRHEYLAEKADALNRLAALITAIINPPTENVVSLASRVAAR
jgi:integrase